MTCACSYSTVQIKSKKSFAPVLVRWSGQQASGLELSTLSLMLLHQGGERPYEITAFRTKKKPSALGHRAICVRFLILANWQPTLYRPTIRSVGGIIIVIIIDIHNANPIHKFTLLIGCDYSICFSLQGEQLVNNISISLPFMCCAVCS